MNDAAATTTPPAPPSSSPAAAASRGAVWLAALTGGAALRPGYPPSVQVADAALGSRPAR